MALSFAVSSRIIKKYDQNSLGLHSGCVKHAKNFFSAKVIFLKDSGKVNRIEDNEARVSCAQGTFSAMQTAMPAATATAVKSPEPDLNRMMDDYGTSLLRLCFMYLKDRQLAEDAVQETFIKVYRYYDRFDGGANEKTWINRIAVNVCKDMLRSAWNRRVNVVEELNEVPDEAGFGDKADDTLIKAVMALKPKYKEVILLFYYQDMKISEIAKVLEAPESTVSVRLKRARDALAKQLGGWYYDA